MRLLTSVAFCMLFAAGAQAQIGCNDWRDDPLCPIVINFANGGYQLTGVELPVAFDIQATGHPVLLGWTAAGADEAFLSLDRNQNGKIDDGGELFGNAVALSNGTRASNGFVALAELDTNDDALIDENDTIWTKLLLWRDLNHDGVSQSHEIQAVTDSGLVAISLEHHWTGRRDRSGNTYRYQSKCGSATRRSTSRRARCTTSSLSRRRDEKALAPAGGKAGDIGATLIRLVSARGATPLPLLPSSLSSDARARSRGRRGR